MGVESPGCRDMGRLERLDMTAAEDTGDSPLWHLGIPAPYQPDGSEVSPPPAAPAPLDSTPSRTSTFCAAVRLPYT